MPSPTRKDRHKSFSAATGPADRRSQLSRAGTTDNTRRAQVCVFKNGKQEGPGPNGIPNTALKRAIKIAPKMFLHMYNRCLQEGYFPAKWKLQSLVLLSQGKKSPDELSAYRPLCMLDSAGKILERIMYTRIEALAEKHLSHRQNGFRKGRSTVDAINLVVNIAKEAISGTRWKNGEKQYCAV